MNFIFKKDQQAYIIGLLIYTGIILYVIGHHEFWMDESHHWLVARDSNSFQDLIKNYEYDGHPFLWVSLLWILAKFSIKIFFVKLLHVLIAISMIALFLFYAPLKKVWKLLFIFTYFPIYEYSILSRNYALAILFFFLFCMTYPKKKAFLSAFFLGLAANVHLFALFMSVCLFFKMLYENRTIRYLKNASIIYVPLLFIAFISIKTPSDHFFYFDVNNMLNIKKIGTVVSMFFRVLCPLPEFFNPHSWNTNLIMNQLQWLAIIPVTLSWLLPLVLLQKKSSKLFFYICATMILSFCMLTGLHITQRIGGFLLFYLLVFMWIERRELKPRQTDYKLTNYLKYTLLITFFFIQIVSGGFFLYKDLKNPFSNTSNIYTFLAEQELLETEIYGGSYCNYIGLHNYGKTLLNIRENRNQKTFCDWKLLTENRDKSDLAYAMAMLEDQDLNELIFLSPHKISFTEKTSQQIKLLQSFTNGIVRNENAYIYLIRKNADFSDIK